METSSAYDVNLAPYAMHGAQSAGRVHAEPAHPYRGPYQRDRDRIVHSSAFRRLAHKTQVFTGTMGDYHRSRLTHTLEVTSIARTAGRALRLNEDLIEAMALVHDIGHPPFGHAGEDVLDACVADIGGFNHNAQALRIVERIETRYPDFPGLNLSREVLAGQQSRSKRDAAGGRLLEVQTVDAADSIAYTAHDADDAVELGMLTLEELNASRLWRTAAANVGARYGALDGVEFRRAAVRELLDLFVGDVIRTSTVRLAEAAPTDEKAASQHPAPLIGASDVMKQEKAELQRLLFDRVYRHPTVLEQRARACAALEEMFGAILRDRTRLPAKFAAIAAEEGLPRAAVDYLAGMTDRFALEEHDRLVRSR